MTTGSLDLEEAFESVLRAGLTTEAFNTIAESDTFQNLKNEFDDFTSSLTQDTIVLADGTELPLDTYGNNTFVTLPDGSEVAYADFIQQTAEAGNAVVQEIDRSLNSALEGIADAFESSGTAQGVVNFIEGAASADGTEGGTAVVPLPNGSGVDNRREQEEDDIFTDTTQQATGLSLVHI